MRKPSRLRGMAVLSLAISLMGQSASADSSANDNTRSNGHYRLPPAGSLVPPYPDGLTSYSGTCVTDPHSGDICGRGVGTIDVVSGQPVAFYAGELAARNASGEAIWRITDIAKAPTIPKGYVADTGLCLAQPDSRRVVAVLRWDSGSVAPADVIWGMVLDPATGRFEDIAVRHITCEGLVP